MEDPQVGEGDTQLKSKAARGIVWTMTQVLGSRGSAFVVFLVLARLLAPSAFGLFAYAQAFVLVVQAITDNAVSTVIVQRKSLRAADLDTIFWANLGLAVLLTLAGVLGGPGLAGILREPDLGPLLQVLSASFLIAGISGVQIGVLRRDFDFRAVALRSVGGEVLGGAAGIVVALTGGGVWALVVQRLIASATGSAILWAASPWRPRLRFTPGVLREVAGFAASVVGSRVLWVFSTRVDDFLIGFFLGPVALGYYTVAFKITRFMTQILSGTMLHVALSTFSRLQAELERLRRGLLSALRLSGLVAIPAFIWLMAMAEPLTVGLFGERWLPTASVMRILAAVGLVYSHRTISEAVLVSLGRPAWWVTQEAARIALMVLGILVAVDYGILAVAVAVALSQFLTIPVLIRMMHRLTGVRPLQILAQNWSAVIGSGLMLAATMAVLPALSARLVPLGVVFVEAGLALATYSLVMLLIDRRSLATAFHYIGTVLPSFRRGRDRGD